MAQNSEALRQIVQTICDHAEQALKLLDSSEEKRSFGWKCKRCGYVKHFTRPVVS